MGSYLMNCFVSNQVIPDGIEVVAFPIRQQKDYEACELSRGELKISETANYNNTCYNNSCWDSLGLVFTAKSEESYRLTLHDSPMNRMSLIIFFHKILTETFITQKGSNDAHDFAFNAKGVIKSKSSQIFEYLSANERFLTINQALIKKTKWQEFIKIWEEIEKLIHENRVFIRDYKGRPCLLQMSLCLKSSYDYMIKKIEPGYNLRRIDDQINNFDKHLKNYKKIFKKTDPKSLRFFTMDVFKFLSGDGSSIGYHSYIFDRCSKNKVTPSKELGLKLKKEFQPIIDLSQFQHGLNHLNLKFMPMAGGSQDYMNETGRLYSSLVTTVLNENQKFLDKKYKDY